MRLTICLTIAMSLAGCAETASITSIAYEDAQARCAFYKAHSGYSGPCWGAKAFHDATSNGASE